ncbi:MAG TPA: ABC transporter permease [Acidimicrobiales bacterium]|nr:ABC transporter permease [Acidimicrobiales bacterium]
MVPSIFAGLPDLAARRRATPLWRRAFAYWCYQFTRTWRSTLTASIVYPVLYLAALGVGLGSLVDHHLGTGRGVGGLDGVTYLRYVAPGILAGSVMQIAVNESTYPVMAATKWVHTYDAMLATPLRVLDVLAGHVGFVLLRLLVTSATFCAIAAGFGALVSPEAALAVPAGVVTGLAFATPVMAFAVTQERDSGFSVIHRLFVVPLFLFSGSFFPISQLPGFWQEVAVVTPLYHGVALCRACTLGRLWTPACLAHAAYLLALASAGWVAARRTFRRRLAP